MYGISEEQILAWIDQCDNQLRQLKNGKEFLHQSYYEKDLINYSVEENLRDQLGESIRDIKSKREFLTRMLNQIHTTDNVEMFDYLFPDTLVNQLPEDLRTEFLKYVYEV